MMYEEKKVVIKSGLIFDAKTGELIGKTVNHVEKPVDTRPVQVLIDELYPSPRK